MQAFNSIRDGIANVVELNSSLANINMTMGVSRDGMDLLTSSAQKMSKEMGVAISDVIKTAKVYANMNETIESILEKSRADTFLQLASGMSSEETTDSIQALMNQFEMEATGSAERIADTLEKVSASMPMDFSKSLLTKVEILCAK